jgi:hypothetical protein
MPKTVPNKVKKPQGTIRSLVELEHMIEIILRQINLYLVKIT